MGEIVIFKGIDYILKNKQKKKKKKEEEEEAKSYVIVWLVSLTQM
jgi:small neutral amino acid transporter SnatA (MarC family)